MIIETRVPENHDRKVLFRRLKEELDRAKIPLDKVSLDTLRSEHRTFDGGNVLQAFVYVTSDEELNKWHIGVMKILQEEGFEVKKQRA